MMKKITSILIILLLACALAFTGCSAKGENDVAYNNEAADYAVGETVEHYYNGDVKTEYPYASDAALGEVTGGSAALGTSLAENRKLIKTVWLTVETENYTELMRAIEGKVDALGGYIEEMESNTPTSGKHRYASMTVRIPADRLAEFTEQVENSANVIWRNQNQKDITTTYVDTQARRDALEVEQERLLELLAQAENLNEILEIESRLTDVRYELESIESTLRSYDNQVDYATVHLDVEEVEVLTVVEEEEPGFWEKIGDGFIKSAKGVWNAIKSIFSALVIALPYLVVILLPPAIVLIIIFSVKKRKNRR